MNQESSRNRLWTTYRSGSHAEIMARCAELIRQIDAASIENGYQMNELTANLVYSARQTLEAALRHLARS